MKHLLLILVGAALCYLIMTRFGGASGREIASSDTTVVHDTSYITHDTVVYKKLKVTEVIHDTLPPRMIPNPNYDSLVVQYKELADEYLAKKIYQDTFKIDTIGWVALIDTVQHNEIKKRKYSSHYNIPVIKETKTITNTLAPTRDIFFGGGVSANKAALGTLNLGILYKDRKDHMYGTFVSAGVNGKLFYGVQAYWKINHKNKKP